MRVSSAKPVKWSFLKWLAELLLNNPLGNAIDDALMKVTARRWMAKTMNQQRNAKGAIMAMDVNKHYSKPDPRNFQYKLLAQYRQKLANIMRRAHASVAN